MKRLLFILKKEICLLFILGIVVVGPDADKLFHKMHTIVADSHQLNAVSQVTVVILDLCTIVEVRQ